MTSTVVVSVAVITLALLLLGAGVVAAFSYLRQPNPHQSDLQVGLGERVAELEVIVRGLPSLWEEERERAKKHANAAKTANREAAKKLEEVEELIETGLEVQGADAPGSNQREMFAVSPRLGDPPSADRNERVAAVAHLLR